jgi:hypothetical protein
VLYKIFSTPELTFTVHPAYGGDVFSTFGNSDDFTIMSPLVTLISFLIQVIEEPQLLPQIACQKSEYLSPLILLKKAARYRIATLILLPYNFPA